jgi:hypothetical protein
VKQRVRWPDPRKPSVIHDESRELGPGGGSYGHIGMAGDPIHKNEERSAGKLHMRRASGVMAKWR